MKLRLPLFLLSGILSLHLTMTASADVIGGGVFYDVGKYDYSIEYYFDEVKGAAPAGAEESGKPADEE